MTWVRLEAQRALNPKLMKAGLAARGLDEAAICLSSMQGTDGHLTEADVAMLAVGHGCKSWRPLVDRLVDQRRWEEEGSGLWVLHDFLEFNPSRDEWRGLVEKRREAGRRGGKHTAKAQASASASAAPNGKQVLEHVPKQEIKPLSLASKDLTPPSPPLPAETTAAANAKSDDEEDKSSQNGKIGLAVRLVAERRLARTTSVVAHRAAWLAACERSITAEADLTQLDGSVLTVEQLADRIEPKAGRPEDRAQAAAEATYARNGKPPCGECGCHGGGGRIVTGDGRAIPCPLCGSASA